MRELELGRATYQLSRAPSRVLPALGIEREPGGRLWPFFGEGAPGFRLIRVSSERTGFRVNGEKGDGEEGKKGCE